MAQAEECASAILPECDRLWRQAGVRFEATYHDVPAENWFAVDDAARAAVSLVVVADLGTAAGLRLAFLALSHVADFVAAHLLTCAE